MNLYQKLTDHQRATLESNQVKYPVAAKEAIDRLQSTTFFSNLDVKSILNIMLFLNESDRRDLIFMSIYDVFIEFAEIETHIKLACDIAGDEETSLGEHTAIINGSALVNGDNDLTFKGVCHYEVMDYEPTTVQGNYEKTKWSGLVELSNADGCYYSQQLNINL